jgi:RimJ/RimL family protein N-acetyltransferase
MSPLPLDLHEIPRIETARLRLRGHTAADFAASCTLWAEPDVVRFTVGKPQSPEEVWSRLLRYLGLWSLLGFGYWVVEEKDTHAFVGEVGLCNFHREIDPPLGNTPEIGWTLLPTHQGKGYATEATQACMQWAAESPLAPKEIACIIHTDNAASLRVAAKCGFQPRFTTTYRGSPTTVLYATLP